ncbi:MAG: PAS domain-containing protein [Azonexus sp.]|nr:PAS domain-containing protein [Azonexus sp.]
MFIATKDEGVIPYVLTQILDACVNGVTLSDPDLPDSPLVYVNRVFEEMSGYTQDEMIGRNCRFLQGEDREQPALQTLREAIRQHQACTVTLRNYRKNGELFLNKLSIRPLVDRENRVIYYLGIQYDLSRQSESGAAPDLALRL